MNDDGTTTTGEAWRTGQAHELRVGSTYIDPVNQAS